LENAMVLHTLSSFRDAVGTGVVRIASSAAPIPAPYASAQLPTIARMAHTDPRPGVRAEEQSDSSLPTITYSQVRPAPPGSVAVGTVPHPQ
jgi:hypothetical protein